MGLHIHAIIFWDLCVEILMGNKIVVYNKSSLDWTIKTYRRKTAKFPILAWLPLSPRSSQIRYTERERMNRIIWGPDWNIIGVSMCQAISKTEAKTRQLTEAKQTNKKREIDYKTFSYWETFLKSKWIIGCVNRPTKRFYLLPNKFIFQSVSSAHN